MFRGWPLPYSSSETINKDANQYALERWFLKKEHWARPKQSSIGSNHLSPIGYKLDELKCPEIGDKCEDTIVFMQKIDGAIPSLLLDGGIPLVSRLLFSLFLKAKPLILFDINLFIILLLLIWELHIIHPYHTPFPVLPGLNIICLFILF